MKISYFYLIIGFCILTIFLLLLFKLTSEGGNKTPEVFDKQQLEEKINTDATEFADTIKKLSPGMQEEVDKKDILELASRLKNNVVFESPYGSNIDLTAVNSAIEILNEIEKIILNHLKKSKKDSGEWQNLINFKNIIVSELDNFSNMQQNT